MFIPYPLIEIYDGQYLTDSGSEVNELEHPIYPWRFTVSYCTFQKASEVIERPKDLGVAYCGNSSRKLKRFLRLGWLSYQIKERTAYFVIDKANDKRAFVLAKRVLEAMKKLSTAVALNPRVLIEKGIISEQTYKDNDHKEGVRNITTLLGIYT